MNNMDDSDSSNLSPGTGTNMIRTYQPQGHTPAILRAFLQEGDSASISSTSINGENKIKSIILSKRRQHFNSDVVNL